MPEFVDPYLDPETGLLRSRLGAASKKDLANAEADLVAARHVQLAEGGPIRPTGDLRELCAVHGHLFQDVYDWAGTIRTVDIRKPGGKHFMPVANLERGAVFAAEQLRDENMLKGLSRGEFIDRLAHHYDQFNYLHPFR